MHFYICNENGSINASMSDAGNKIKYKNDLPEYVPEPGSLSIIQAYLNDHH